MMRNCILSCLAIGSLFIASCATTNVALPIPTQTDADRAAQKFPGATLAELQKGKAEYEEHCQGCHTLKAPESRSEEGWRKIVPPMARKAKIDTEEENLILRYVVTMSAHTPQ